MSREELIQRLMATFLGELEDHVRNLNQDLIGLERETGGKEKAERLRTLFRTAHSLKGAARSVGVRVIEEACHELEDILSGLRDGHFPITPELTQLLFATADALSEAEKRLRGKQDLAGTSLEAMLPRLRSRSGPPPEPERPSASPGPGPEPEAPASESESWVRIRPEKLDALLSHAGELLVARRRSELRHAELAALEDTLVRWRRQWARTKKLLKEEARKSDGNPEESNRAAVPGAGPSALALAIEENEGSLRKLESDLERLRSTLAGDRRAIEQTALPLEEGLRRARMLPFAQACEGFERAVRDLAKSGGKDIDLAVEGGDVEIDRHVLDQLKDPLLHLVRNAADHGIERPDERSRAGKPSKGKIRVRASLRGPRVEITVEDDGQGIRLPMIREQARKRKLSEPKDEDALARLIFQPGFSTSPIITEISGRGIGLDVVKSRVESLHGSISFSFKPGRGTRFLIDVPLTLTSVRALIVSLGGRELAIPLSGVVRLVRAGAADLGSVQGREVLLGGPEPVPIFSLAAVLASAAIPPERSGGKVPVVVLGSRGREAAFTVDALDSEQEIVIKALGHRLKNLEGISGAAILPTGRVALVLSAGELVEKAFSRSAGDEVRGSFAGSEPKARKRILVVDDSVTTRSLERSILESAGYEVLSAVDGQEGWQFLQEKGADLVVADVEMPRMDGLTLAQTIRASKRFRDVPVVLVTALGSEKDKARGVEVGADAYLVKSAFDQRSLLETLARLI